MALAPRRSEAGSLPFPQSERRVTPRELRLMSSSWKVVEGDCRELLAGMPSDSVHCCVTSPPYWGLRDYGAAGQIGLEQTPEAYVAEIVAVFREVRRVLRVDGTLWLNLGDSYASDVKGSGGDGKSRLGPYGDLQNIGFQKMHPRRFSHGLKPKDLVGIPWRVALALQADGWWLRSDIIWHKPNPMPESVTDRPTKAHEYLFLLSKSATYYYDADAISESGEWCGKQLGIVRGVKRRALAMGRQPSGNEVDGADANAPERRNRRTVWTIAPRPFSGAHFAVMPPDLVKPCILAGCPSGGTVLDPFAGAGTVGLVATRLARKFIGCEINMEYAKMARERIIGDAPLLNREI